jgi:hypothetical protein
LHHFDDNIAIPVLKMSLFMITLSVKIGFKIEGWDDIQRVLDDYQKDLTLKLLTTGQDVLQKLQRQCVMTLLVSLSNRSSSRRILEILALTLN